MISATVRACDCATRGADSVRREAPGSREHLFDIKAYLAELVVSDGSRWIGRHAHELEQALVADVIVGSIGRGDRVLPASSAYPGLRAGDLVIVQADAG